ncbi:sterol desaturase family protein [Marinobacter sp.]|uniref:sterol desaturase family protein n=1 Tax=Marinobacter sp. TaxID=50741 RepID=UPI00384DEE7C
MEFLLSHIQTLLGYPLDSGKRVYVFYLLGSLAMVLLVMALRLLSRDRNGAAGIWKAFASPGIWFHPSARLDYQLLAINPLIRTFFLGFVGISLVPVALATSNFLERWAGSLSLDWPGLQITAAYTLVLFVADDFTRFLLHYLMHKLPWLWSIHRLHHSAEVMTPFTVYRIHPLESLLYSLRMVITQGLVLGLFFFAVGMNLSVWEIAGANAFTYLFNLAGANLRHSHVWISWGPWLERIFISPAQHQIHHSSDPRHFDRNMGAFLAVWDGLFHTLLVARGEQVSGYGLSRGKPSPHTSLARAYIEPCTHALRRIVRSRPLKSRIITCIDNEYHLDSRS